MKTIRRYLMFYILVAVFACDESDYDYSADASNVTGTAGSLARFAISDDYLYSVDFSTLKVFDITNEKLPQPVGETYVDFGIETIFIKGELLLLGTQTGVYIYDISNPVSPIYISTFLHIQSCDPVVVKNNYAYSTLNSNGPCGGGLNELDIIDITVPSSPQRVNTITMESPKGLGISGLLLFVCDAGLKMYDLTDPVNPDYIRTINIPAFDVIPIDTLLLVATEEGLAEYSIVNNNQVQFISSLYSK